MDEVCETSWADLPHVVLLKLFSYLSLPDRERSAMVCPAWGSVLHSPSLWRQRTLKITGLNERTDASSIRFADRYGKHLFRVTIKCENSHSRHWHLKKFTRNICQMLTKLRRASLRRFTLSRLDIDRFYKLESKQRRQIILAVVNILRRQKFLKVFDMEIASLMVADGCKILEILATYNSRRLEALQLEDFFKGDAKVYDEPAFVRSISQFTNLNTIHINYNCLSVEILKIILANNYRTLHNLEIKCHRMDPHDHRIMGLTSPWARTRKMHQLTVNFYFEGVLDLESITGILSPVIPLRGAQFLGFDSEETWEPNRTLRYLRQNFPHTIEDVVIDIPDSVVPIGEELFDLVRACRCLVSVDISGVVESTILEDVLKFRSQQGKQSLFLVFRVKLMEISDQNFNELLASLEKYRYLKTEFGFDFEMTHERYWSFSNNALNPIVVI